MNAEAGTPADVALGTAFVSELNPTGTALVYSTYIGGSGNGSFGEGAQAIAVDTATPPNIYITGFTGSPDFPVSTTLAPLARATRPGKHRVSWRLGVHNEVESRRLLELHNLSTLATSAATHSTRAWHRRGRSRTRIYRRGDGVHIHKISDKRHPDFSPGNPVRWVTPFLTEFDTTASGAASLVYSTYLGGSGTGGNGYLFGFGDIAFGVTIDTNSNAYVVGGTTSTDFPTEGTAIPGSAACGANTNGSAFISVINTTAGTLGLFAVLELAAGKSKLPA